MPTNAQSHRQDNTPRTASEIAERYGHVGAGNRTTLIAKNNSDFAQRDDQAMNLSVYGFGESAYFAWVSDGNVIGEKVKNMVLLEGNIPQPTPNIDYVVYSEGEAKANDGAGYWSNSNGWAGLDEAECFTTAEIKQLHLNLPVSAHNDAQWLPVTEAHEMQDAPATEIGTHYDHGNPIMIEESNVSLHFKGDAYAAMTLVNDLHAIYDIANRDMGKMIHDFVFNLEVGLQNAGIIDQDFNEIVIFDLEQTPPFPQLYFDGYASDCARVATELRDVYSDARGEMPDAVARFAYNMEAALNQDEGEVIEGTKLYRPRPDASRP